MSKEPFSPNPAVPISLHTPPHLLFWAHHAPRTAPLLWASRQRVSGSRPTWDGCSNLNTHRCSQWKVSVRRPGVLLTKARGQQTSVCGQPLPTAVNEVLLQPRHVYSLTYCLWGLPCSNSGAEWLLPQRLYGPQSLKHLLFTNTESLPIPDRVQRWLSEKLEEKKANSQPR